ncbi:MAG: GNAT family N-acetyltransferase [Alphaproteobacteria bacterium]|nr:GNAT family N-acetyltransferase [Alphaproteobacteria bacterium]
MSVETNALGQPIGAPVPGWTPRRPPPRTPIEGRFCRLEPLDPERHARDLFRANSEDREGRMWTYLPYGPYPEFEAYLAKMEAAWLGDDPLVHAVIDGRSGKAAGVAGLMRINASAGSIEVGGIAYAPALQRTPAATEAMFLLMRRVFDELGYRRYEWKCNALNAASRAAALRLGFRFEGIFRQADVVKGRNRDTAWFSILDREWPPLKTAFESWLDAGNFDELGRQRVSLSSLTAARD